MTTCDCPYKGRNHVHYDWCPLRAANRRHAVMADPAIAFTKHVYNGGWTGGWAFAIGDAGFVAIRNEAGFAHRDWELWTLDARGYQDRCIEDQLASRAECVAVAQRVAIGA